MKTKILEKFLTEHPEHKREFLHKKTYEIGQHIECRDCGILIVRTVWNRVLCSNCGQREPKYSRKVFVPKLTPEEAKERKRLTYSLWIRTAAGAKYKKNANLKRHKHCKKRINPDEWFRLIEAYNFSCLLCGRREPEIELTKDHIVPISAGGEHEIENLQPLCRSCNSKKGARTIDYRNERVV